MGEDDSNTEYHLGNLNYGNTLCNSGGDFDSHGHNGIIRVHNCVNKEINSSKVESMTSVPLARLITVPTEEHSYNVMVPMQENEGFFPQNDEQGVHKFQSLGKIKKKSIKLGVHTPKTPPGTDRSPPTTFDDRYGDEGEGVDGASNGKSGKEEVPGDEGAAEIKGFAVFHGSLNPKHNRAIQRHRDQKREIVIVKKFYRLVYPSIHVLESISKGTKGGEEDGQYVHDRVFKIRSNTSSHPHLIQPRVIIILNRTQSGSPIHPSLFLFLFL
eukprot:CAMPEP_0201537352 /NCGR_PEP_ID=MMETSP0161_2-20130828/64496_1 /ASSEMBLY_ACC=CAM_ASM_000251 /TAXON_ID=180227 /ORGANISM="Neoparamoeba aestuarina, Strain SoJaBio B1-5/56/2" /LENGTH=269 /DNA_ID=CAMNT_0047943583 /DNA_START=222 /DNA_END=1027 /DNA_ORIENTATION=+